MAIAYIGVGSNIEPEENIIGAIKMLSVETTVLDVSSFYKTSFVNESGVVDETTDDFYNGVFKVEVFFEPFTLKSYLRDIEKELGRVRSPAHQNAQDDSPVNNSDSKKKSKFDPRTIDLDILIYDNYIIKEPWLTVPDLDIWTREFVAVPLLELMGDDAELPFEDNSKLEPKLKAVADALKTSNMAFLGDFTESLKSFIKSL